MPSTLYPPGSAFRIDGVHSDTFQMYLRGWTPVVQPSIRGSSQDISGRAGKSLGSQEFSSRLITLDIGVYDDSRSTAVDLVSAFAAAMSPETAPHVLLLEDDVPNWKLFVTPSSSGGSNITWGQASNGFATFQITLEAMDPHWYSVTPQAPPVWQPRTTLGSRQVTLPNSGNRSTPLLFSIAHPGGGTALTGLKIAYGGSSFQYDGSLSAGGVLLVNTADFSVKKNGVDDLANWHGDDFPNLPGTTTGLAPGTPPLAAPVNTVLTWTDTNVVGANVTITYTERKI